MKNPFQPGDKKEYQVTVTHDMLAQFEAGVVHEVYGTFALGRDAEWACRLFVLEMLEPGEEGIGAQLTIDHIYPAPVGSKVKFEATLEKVLGNEVVCRYEAFANGKVVAKGIQVQKIIDKGRFDKLLQSIELH